MTDKNIKDAHDRFWNDQLTLSDFRDDKSYVYNNALQERRPKAGQDGVLPRNMFTVDKGLFEYLDMPGFPAAVEPLPPNQYDAVYLYAAFRVTVTINNKNPVSKMFGFFMRATSDGTAWTLTDGRVYRYDPADGAYQGREKSYP